MTLLDVFSAYWPVLAVSLFASLLTTPACRKIALRYGIVDRPDDWLKPHGKPIPYLGGVAVFLGWLAGLVVAFFLFQKGTLESPPTNSAPSIDTSIILGIVFAGTAIMLIGLLDDIRPPPTKGAIGL